MNKADRKNAGFTLVELIVVVAILGIIVGGVAIGFSMLNKKNVDKAAKRVDVMMEKVRNWNMSKKDMKNLTIKKDSEGYHLFEGANEDSDGLLLGSGSNIEYVYVNSSSPGTEHTSSFTKFDVIFQRSGAIKYKKESANLDADVEVQGIRITNGSKTVNITLVADTGKHFIN